MSTQNPFTEELLSAYLDDELSAQRRAEVEQALSSHPDLRKLHDKLLAVREGLKCVTKHEAPDGFSDGVLARIQESVTLRENTHSMSREGGWRRGLIWSAVAIAAAIAVMLFPPGKWSDPSVADNRGSDNRTDDGGSIGTSAKSNLRSGPAEAGDEQRSTDRNDQLEQRVAASEEAVSLAPANAGDSQHVQVASDEGIESSPPSLELVGQAGDHADAGNPLLMTADQTINLPLADEAALRLIAADYNVKFVREEVPGDFSKKLLLVESDRDAIQKVMRRLEEAKRLETTDADLADKGHDLASFDSSAQRFSLRLDLDPIWKG